jgi:hypothetical protein
VVDALRSGRWNGPWGEEIRRHAASCAACSEVALVARALQRADQQADVRLPSAGLVWWKAQLAARRDAERRAAEPIAFAERAAEALAALTVIVLAIWQWPRIAGWFGGRQPLAQASNGFAIVIEWVHRFFQGFAGGPVILLLATLGTFLALVAVAAYVVWREE